VARPTRFLLAAACGSLLIALAGCGGGDDDGNGGGNGSGAPASQAEQVAAGQDVYAAECAQCHGDQGQGGTGPVLIGGSKRIASYQDTARLYDYVSRTMPFDDPGTLSEQQYWDVIAYLLDENDLLPADTVLSPESEPLELKRE
jgi:S-disulfanyl-L-cysteine oxidoreductase SoxD